MKPKFKKIKLTQNKVALVDVEDFGELNKVKWHFNGKYAERRILLNGKSIRLRMHRVINKTPEGMETDHINGKKLDNRKSNLRSCTHSENAMNTVKKSTNSSGYKGVHRCKMKYGDKVYVYWRARICINYERIYLGIFKTQKLASKVYIEASKKYHKEFARFQ